MKRFTIFLIIGVVVASGMISCAREAKPTPTQTPVPKVEVAKPSPKVEKVRLTIGSGPAGGGLHVRMEAIAEAIRRGAPNYEVTLISAPVEGNLVALGRGERDMAVGPASIILPIVKGLPPHEKPVALKSLFTEAMIYYQMVVEAKTGLTSIQDIKDKKCPLKVSVGGPGHAPNLATRKIFKAFGLTYEDINSWGGKVHEVASAQGNELFRDRLTEAMFHCDIIPYPTYMDIARTRDLRMLTVPTKAIEEIVKEGEYLALGIPANSYTFVKEPIPTIGFPNIMVSRPELSEEVAYTVVKAIHTQKDYLVSAYPPFAHLTPEILAMSGEVLPLHPGTAKYFSEIGALKKK